MAAAAKTEPKLDVIANDAGGIAAAPPVAAVVTGALAATPDTGSQGVPQNAPIDQLSRVEDKTARIEEKFARAEERMMRVEGALEKATLRLEGATQDMNLQGVKDDISRLREQVRGKPGVVTIFLIALVAALIGAGVTFALTRFGIPGLIR